MAINEVAGEGIWKSKMQTEREWEKKPFGLRRFFKICDDPTNGKSHDQNFFFFFFFLLFANCFGHRAQAGGSISSAGGDEVASIEIVYVQLIITALNSLSNYHLCRIAALEIHWCFSKKVFLGLIQSWSCERLKAFNSTESNTWCHHGVRLWGRTIASHHI